MTLVVMAERQIDEKMVDYIRIPCKTNSSHNNHVRGAKNDYHTDMIADSRHPQNNMYNYIKVSALLKVY